MDIDFIASNGLALAFDRCDDLGLEVLCALGGLAYVSSAYGHIEKSRTIVDDVGEDGRECQCENSEKLHGYGNRNWRR